MRHHGEASASTLAPPTPALGTVSTSATPATPPAAARTDWATLRRLFPYLWTYKWRVIAALTFMVGAKVANVGVPLLLKDLVDAMSFKPGDPQAVLIVPIALLIAYGLLRLSTTLVFRIHYLFCSLVKRK